MAGRTRSIQFVSVWTKFHWSEAIDSVTGKSIYAKPGLDDGQPETGTLRRLSDGYVWKPSNSCIWYANIGDVVGNRAGINPFTFIRYKGAFHQVSGFSPQNGLSWPGYEMQNVCMGQGYSIQDPLIYFPNLSQAQKVEMVNRIIQSTNPSRPSVSLPTFVAELREIPEMIFTNLDKLVSTAEKAASLRTWMSSMGLSKAFMDTFFQKVVVKKGGPNGAQTYTVLRQLRTPTLERMWSVTRKSMDEAGQANLTYRWGVRPLVNDLVKVLRLQKDVNARIERFERLYRRGRFSRRVTLPARQSVTTTGAAKVLFSTAGGGTSGVLHQVMRERVWGSVVWRLPDTRQPPAWLHTDSGRADVARKIALGMTGREALALLWEVTPNSWLSDWFFGIGDFINATNNTLNLIASRVCIMRHLRTTSQWVITQRPIWQNSVRNVPGFFERKTRDVSMPAVVLPTFGVPILTKGQWSIVASLALSRRK